MTKVFIHLSGKINSKIERKIALVDIVYNVNKYNKHPFKNVIQLEPSKNVETEKIISEQLGILFEEMNDCKILDRELVQIFLNDYFSYTIKPAYYLVELILNIINKNIEKEIIFITSRYDSLLLPMFGFKTTESLRGSAHLFYASLLPQILKNINPKVKYRVVYSYGDTLSVPFFRNSFLKNVNLALYSIYIAKLMLLLSLSKNKDSNNSSNLIMVRNNHQARFAKIISINLDDSAVLFLPQLSQGSFKGLVKIYKELEAGKKFQAVVKEFGSTDEEKNSGGAVMGSPILPDEVYEAFKGQKKDFYTKQPILFNDKYFIFNRFYQSVVL